MTRAATALTALGGLVIAMGVLHVVVGARLFAPDRRTGRPDAQNALWRFGPPRSEAGRYTTLVGSFYALGVNWMAMGVLMVVTGDAPPGPLTRTLLRIVVCWGLGNLYCALRWVRWNLVAQVVFVASTVTALLALGS